MRRMVSTAACVLLMVMMIGLVSCTKKDSSATGAAASPGGRATATRTIVDHTGAEVVLPAEIDRIVIAGLMPMPSV